MIGLYGDEGNDSLDGGSDQDECRRGKTVLNCEVVAPRRTDRLCSPVAGRRTPLSKNLPATGGVQVTRRPRARLDGRFGRLRARAGERGADPLGELVHNSLPKCIVDPWATYGNPSEGRRTGCRPEFVRADRRGTGALLGACARGTGAMRHYQWRQAAWRSALAVRDTMIRSSFDTAQSTCAADSCPDCSFECRRGARFGAAKDRLSAGNTPER
jgi:hypothetical protein